MIAEPIETLRNYVKEKNCDSTECSEVNEHLWIFRSFHVVQVPHDYNE